MVNILEESDDVRYKRGENNTFGVNVFGFKTLNRITGYLCVKAIVVWHLSLVRLLFIN